MLNQLQTPIPIKTPKGKAWAIAIIDYGPQWDLQWVSFLHESGECWTFRNSEIRQDQNYTFGLPAPSPFREPSAPIEKKDGRPDDPSDRGMMRQPLQVLHGS